MSMRNVLIGVAVGAVGLGALLSFRGRDKDHPENKDRGDAMSKHPQRWLRSTRLASPPESAIDHPLGMAVDGDFLYFVTGGFANAQNAIHRLPTIGGKLETLTKTDQILSGELAIDDDSVYFTSEVDGAIFAVKKSGGAPNTLAKVSGAKYLAVDDTHVYFVTVAKQESGGTVQRVAKSGGNPEVLASGHPWLDSVVVDAQSVYFRSNKGLFRIPKAGGEAQVLLARSDKQNLLRVVADSTSLYFFLETKDSGKFAVARLSKSGGAPQMLSDVVDSAGRLALSDSHVYFFRPAGSFDDVLAKVKKIGGETETVDGSGSGNGYITVAGGNVYFGDIDTIYRAPK